MLSVALSVGSPRPAVSGHPCPEELGLSSAAAPSEADGSGRPVILRRFNSSRLADRRGVQRRGAPLPGV